MPAVGADVGEVRLLRMAELETPGDARRGVPSRGAKAVLR